MPGQFSYVRSVIKSKGADGAEDPTASSALLEVRTNFLKEFPESWDGFHIDEETLKAHSEPKTAPGLEALKTICLCGSKNGTVFTGLDNFGIPSIRLQARAVDKYVGGNVTRYKVPQAQASS